MGSEKEEYTFFWGITFPFSQWHPAVFSIEHMEFNCAEQFMMYKKAEMFEDLECRDKIMRTSNPLAQKRLGRTVKEFDMDRWLESAYDIVRRGNVAKVG